MKLCGLTGGVGMGKTTTARFLQERGARVVDTDDLARELVQPGQPALARIQKLFGPDIIDRAGALRRDQLAAIVFADPVARKKLEAILHPPIRERWQAQVNAWRTAAEPLAIVVIPLLFETGAETLFDKIICTACSSAAQRARLTERGWSADQAAQRIAAQLPADEKIARSHFVVWTDGTLEAHRQQVERILETLGCLNAVR